MTIRGGGSTAIYTAYTITLFTVLTLFYNVFAAYLHCLNSSMYAYIHCLGRLKCYWNGLMCF